MHEGIQSFIHKFDRAVNLNVITTHWLPESIKRMEVTRSVDIDNIIPLACPINDYLSEPRVASLYILLQDRLLSLERMWRE